MANEKLIIDAENAVLGRLASYAAKQALLGREIIIVNSNKAIITGNSRNIAERYSKKRARGGSGQAGPYFPTTPGRIIKRTIRNMLPYKQGRGRDAFLRIKCHESIPKEFESMKMIKSKRGKQGMLLEYLSEMLRGKKK